MKLSRDTWTGLAALAASLFLFFMTLGLKDSPLVPIGPGFYPRIVLGLTAVLAAALLFFSLKKRDEPAAEAKERENYRLVFIVFLVFGVYAGALPLLGYRIATLAFMIALQVAIDFPASRKQWLLVAVTALVTTIASYIVFERYLSVLLPRGRWTDF